MRVGIRSDEAPRSIHCAAGGDRPELLDAVAADADIPIVEVNGGIATAGDEADLVAEPEAVRGARDADSSVLVRGALVCRLESLGHEWSQWSGTSKPQAGACHLESPCAFQSSLVRSVAGS